MSLTFTSESARLRYHLSSAATALFQAAVDLNNKGFPMLQKRLSAASSVALNEANESRVREAAVAKEAATQAAQDKQDAERFRKLCALLENAYDSGSGIESESLLGYCSMESGFRDMRTVRAELRWTDKRDEPLNLAAALDALPN